MVPKIFSWTFSFAWNQTVSSSETVLNLSGQSGILVGIALGPRGLEGGSSKIFYASLSLTIDGTQVFSFNTQDGIEALLSFFGEEQGSRLLFRLPFSNSVSLNAQVRREGTSGPARATLIALVLLDQ
jgi:hypothetical protein